jgi:hypothetical protein
MSMIQHEILRARGDRTQALQHESVCAGGAACNAP